MGFIRAFTYCWANSLNFSARASRSEYWYWFLWVFIINIPISLIGQILRTQGLSEAPVIISALSTLATLLPSFAVEVRRLHDRGKSGWWLLWFWALTALTVLSLVYQAITLAVVFIVFTVTLGGWLVYQRVMPGLPGPNRWGDTVSAQSSWETRSSSAAVPSYSYAPSRSTGTGGSAPADPYEIAGRELQAQKTLPAIWARALVEADGDEGRASAAYIRLRVADLQENAPKREAENELARLGIKKVGEAYIIEDKKMGRTLSFYDRQAAVDYANNWIKK